MKRFRKIDWKAIFTKLIKKLPFFLLMTLIFILAAAAGFLCVFVVKIAFNNVLSQNLASAYMTVDVILAALLVAGLLVYIIVAKKKKYYLNKWLVVILSGLLLGVLFHLSYMAAKLLNTYVDTSPFFQDFGSKYSDSYNRHNNFG